jgi:hypothetical protein
MEAGSRLGFRKKLCAQDLWTSGVNLQTVGVDDSEPTLTRQSKAQPIQVLTVVLAYKLKELCSTTSRQ